MKEENQEEEDEFHQEGCVTSFPAYLSRRPPSSSGDGRGGPGGAASAPQRLPGRLAGHRPAGAAVSLGANHPEL